VLPAFARPPFFRQGGAEVSRVRYGSVAVQLKTRPVCAACRWVLRPLTVRPEPDELSLALGGQAQSALLSLFGSSDQRVKLTGSYSHFWGSSE
jgi:hypothetical protein